MKRADRYLAAACTAVQALRGTLALLALHVDGADDPELAAAGDALDAALDAFTRDVAAAALARAARG